MIKNTLMFSKQLEKVNEWWITGKTTLPGNLLKRKELDKFVQELDNRRVTELIGPRRVGKTTLIKQTISYLLEQGGDKRNILYYSLDDPVLYTLSDNLLNDLLEFFLENIAKEGRKYIFFDDIHVYQDWYKWLKAFFDKYENIKFVISGSSSLTLQKEANTYLRGRIFSIELFPSSFAEFLEFNGVQPRRFKFSDLPSLDRLEIKSLEQTVSKIFLEYLLVGGYPEWFSIKDVRSWFEKIINDIPKRAIYEDVVRLYNIKNPEILENIFMFIAENQSLILSYEKINEIAGLHRSILLNYIEYLKASYLVIEVQKYAKKVMERIKSKKKFLILDQGLRNALLKDFEIKLDNIGFIVENVVGIFASKLGQLLYFKTNDEVDFVLKKDNRILPIEVKYRESPDVTRGILNFIKMNKSDLVIVVTKNLFEIKKMDGTIVYFIPAWLFLLTEI